MLSARIQRSISAKTLKKHQKLSSILKYIFVDICKIDQRKYYILGSYALREHRNINDLDINLDHIEFMKLEKAVKKRLGHIEFYNGQIRWKLDLTQEYNLVNDSSENDFSIEAFMKDGKIGFPDNRFSLKHLTKINGLEKDTNGHQYFTLSILKRWKQTMNRPKDISDIRLIQSLLHT